MSPDTIGEAWLTDHRGDHLVEGAGHWVQQENPAEVNAALIAFLDQLDLGGR
jgi:pimeloyl-ACP methyl ester carboxylesterase